jgi:hypothetical protein
MKQHSIVTHAIRQRDIPALPDSWVTNTHSGQMLFSHQLLLLIKRKGKFHPGGGDDGPQEE